MNNVPARQELSKKDMKYLKKFAKMRKLAARRVDPEPVYESAPKVKLLTLNIHHTFKYGVPW